MRYAWVVITIRPDQREDLHAMKAYGPFSSKVKANEWVENQSSVWKMTRIVRVVELTKG